MARLAENIANSAQLKLELGLSLAIEINSLAILHHTCLNFPSFNLEISVKKLYVGPHMGDDLTAQHLYQPS